LILFRFENKLPFYPASKFKTNAICGCYYIKAITMKTTTKLKGLLLLVALFAVINTGCAPRHMAPPPPPGAPPPPPER
jgi:hypothetical protein